MTREQLERIKTILKELKSTEGSNSLMKRAAMLAILLSFVRSTTGLAADADLNKLIKALDSSQTDQSELRHSWRDWKNWKDWKDWSDWNDWKNWNDWKDWKDWRDWRKH